MEKKFEVPAPCPLFRQNPRNIVIRIARMDRQRQPGKLRRPDICPEIRVLHLPRRLVVKIIEPRLANPDHLRMFGQSRNHFRFRHRAFLARM